jgi:hypothetical protein
VRVCGLCLVQTSTYLCNLGPWHIAIPDHLAYQPTSANGKKERVPQFFAVGWYSVLTYGKKTTRAIWELQGSGHRCGSISNCNHASLFSSLVGPCPICRRRAGTNGGQPRSSFYSRAWSGRDRFCHLSRTTNTHARRAHE